MQTHPVPSMASMVANWDIIWHTQHPKVGGPPTITRYSWMQALAQIPFVAVFKKNQNKPGKYKMNFHQRSRM